MQPMTNDAKQELLFWKECLSAFSGRAIWFESGTMHIAYSDASAFGYVVEIVPSVSHGQLLAEEADVSCTWYEFKAVSYCCYHQLGN